MTDGGDGESTKGEEQGETVKKRLSRWYHHELYRYSVPGMTVKFVLEGTYWFLLFFIIYAMASLLPIAVFPYAPLSDAHLIAAGGTGAIWLKSEWCEFTLEDSEI